MQVDGIMRLLECRYRERCTLFSAWCSLRFAMIVSNDLRHASLLGAVQAEREEAIKARKITLCLAVSLLACFHSFPLSCNSLALPFSTSPSLSRSRYPPFPFLIVCVWMVCEGQLLVTGSCDEHLWFASLCLLASSVASYLHRHKDHQLLAMELHGAVPTSLAASSAWCTLSARGSVQLVCWCACVQGKSSINNCTKLLDDE